MLIPGQRNAQHIFHHTIVHRYFACWIMTDDISDDAPYTMTHLTATYDRLFRDSSSAIDLVIDYAIMIDSLTGSIM